MKTWERGSLRKETGQSLYLLALVALVGAVTLGLGALAGWLG
jgi:hypothetical protein